MTDFAEEPAVAAAFLARYLADREAGAVRAAEEYAALFPGFEELVARELRALEADADADGPDPRRDGATIGPYRPLRELGRGGQGVVHLAEDVRLRRRVALKVLDGLGPGSEVLLARFRREAEVAARLDHPGICAVLDAGADGGRAWIAMQLVEGETLARRLARARGGAAGEGAAPAVATGGADAGDESVAAEEDAGSPPVLPPRTRGELDAAVRFFERAARALHAAHEAGIVHRDVKPGNLAVRADGAPVWLDFGLARDESDDDARLTRTGDVFGTPAYMSPEQLRGSRLDRRTDVWSLGATLFEALTLRPPFEAPTREALYRAILEDEAPDVRRPAPAVPRDLAVVVATCLEQDRDRRYGTAADVAEDLRRVAAREPIRARPAGPLLRAGRWVQRNALVAALTAGLLLALLAGLLVTGTLLAESERTRIDLAEAEADLQAQLDDVVAGRTTRRERRIQALLEAGFQASMGARAADARAPFEAVLAEVPDHVAAVVGRAWCELPDGAAALAALDRFGPATGGHPDVAWMRGLVLELCGDADAAAPWFARAGERETDLRTYLRGLRTVQAFGPGVAPNDLRAGLALFRRATLRARRPQFHYVHSWLMAAAYLGDEAELDAAAELLEHHWPDASATLEAIGQFYAARDPARARAAMLRQLELEPSAVPCCGLAHLALREGDAGAARRWYDRGVEIDPGFAPIRYLRAELLRGAGELEAARADLRAGLLADPRYSPAWTALGAVHRALDDPAALAADVAALDRAVPDELRGHVRELERLLPAHAPE